MNRLDYRLKAKSGKARLGEMTLMGHAAVQTPAFMPVATRGAMRGLTTAQLEQTGAQIMLSNTFHLMDRPGTDLVMKSGGIGKFAGWKGPVLTDSGGFQAFSLSHLSKMSDDGITIASPRDGKRILLTPKTVMQAQRELGSDIAMVIDYCPALPATDAQLSRAVELSLNWAELCHDEWYQDRTDEKGSCFCIVQGGVDLALRKTCLTKLLKREWDGIAVGGLSVGEKDEDMLGVLNYLDDYLPSDKPRYLMGVGRPIDLVRCIGSGIDMFDCVLPARNGRNGHIYTSQGLVRIKNQAHATDLQPLDPACQGICCKQHSRAYIHHLFRENEMLGPVLASLHNLHYFQQLMASARKAIEAGIYSEFLLEQEAINRLYN